MYLGSTSLVNGFLLLRGVSCQAILCLILDDHHGKSLPVAFLAVVSEFDHGIYTPLSGRSIDTEGHARVEGKPRDMV